MAVACSGVGFDTVMRGGVAAFDTGGANGSFPLETPAVSSVEPCDEGTVEGTTDGPASAPGNGPVATTAALGNGSIAGAAEGGTATSRCPVVDTVVDEAATMVPENEPLAVLASDNTTASYGAEATRSGEGGADPNRSAAEAVVFSCGRGGRGATTLATEAAIPRTFCAMLSACWDAVWAV